MGIYEWQKTEVFLKHKVISQFCQYKDGVFCVADYSDAGYIIIDRNTNKIDKLTDWRKLEHNSGCVSLVVPPQFDAVKFPYLFARNRFKVDLVDVKNMRVQELQSLMNAPGLQQKLAIRMTKKTMDIYFTNISTDGKSSYVNRLCVDNSFLSKLQQ